VVRANQERTKTLKEMADNSRFFYADITRYEPKAAEKNLTADSRPVLQKIHDALAALPAWEADAIHGVILGVAETLSLKLGKVAQPVRVAVTGATVSPPIDQTLALLGSAATLARLQRAIAWIAQQSA